MSEILSSVEDLGSVRSDVNQVTEEAVQRVQAQSKQAKQIAQQIKKDKAINNQLASFLSFLMRTIEDEAIIQAIVNTFFKTTNPKNQITYLRKDINSYVVVGFFIPFFLEEAAKARIMPLYEKLGATEAVHSLKSYLNYLGKVSEIYHDNVPIDQSQLLHLIILIVQHYLSSNIQSSSYEALKEEIVHVLYAPN